MSLDAQGKSFLLHYAIQITAGAGSGHGATLEGQVEAVYDKLKQIAEKEELETSHIGAVIRSVAIR